MLTQISTWMKDFTSQNTAIAEDETKLARTVAALLVEAAMADGEIDHAEYAHIRHMLVTQLDLRQMRRARCWMNRWRHMMTASKFTA